MGSFFCCPSWSIWKASPTLDMTIYNIIKKLADVTYRIQNCTGQCCRLVVHFDHLKPCRQDMRMEGSFQNKTTSPTVHKLLRNVACEQSTLPIVHNSEDDCYEETLNRISRR